jgi:hypothetical protein
MQTFYSQEQYREYQDEIWGDGYSNEYQRVAAQQLIFRPLRHEEPEARRLTLAGKFVVLHAFPRYCSITDGFLGEEKVIVKACDSQAEAEALVAEVRHDDDGETQTYIYEFPAPVEARPIVEADDDDIPF